jgi:hypothetical protein
VPLTVYLRCFCDIMPRRASGGMQVAALWQDHQAAYRLLQCTTACAAVCYYSLTGNLYESHT